MDRIKKAANIFEKTMNIVFTFCGFLAVAFVILITGFLLTSGMPAIGKIGITDFLFGTEWASTASTPSYGILPFILTSVYGTLGAIIIGVPLGLMCAIFVAKMANDKIAKTVRISVDLLSGIPSIIYGLVGMLIFVQFFSLGTSAVKLLIDNDVKMKENVIGTDKQIDQKERDIETLCMKLLMQQQPVASDLRIISSALKMISDMERIGDHAENIAEWVIYSITGKHAESYAD